MANKNKKMSIEPIGDKVLVKPYVKKGEAKTESGIILPGNGGEERQERGVIVAVGKGKFDEDGERMPMEVKVGDTVLYTKGYDGQELDLNGEEHILIAEHNILAIIK